MKKCIIVYESNHGTVEDCVAKLKNQLKYETEYVKASKFHDVSRLADFDLIIIGASIHAGSVQSKIKEFVTKNQNILIDSARMGLFLCTLSDKEEAEIYFEKNFSPEFLSKVECKGLFGGTVHYERYNWFIKFMMKKITKSSEDINKLHEEEITNFAQYFNK
ncbi:MAG: flavodoxin domain-containing protein [Spirochaetales bacterium]|nr:flavodoxin domain-containing protein [Spirochaetales bacterium]